MKIPLCLSRGGFVEVGIRNKTVGCNTWSGSRTRGKEGEESTLRRFLYVRTLYHLFPFYPLLLLLAS